MTSRANLGFHAAWNMAPGGRAVYSEEGTRLLWEVYPTQIRSWIRRKGGLTRQMIFLRGKELASMYSLCPESATYETAEARPSPSRARSADGTLFAAKQRPM